MPDISSFYQVGTIEINIASIVNFKYNGTVYAAPGVLKHIKKNHGHELTPSVMSDLLGTIKDIIAYPDYVGKHPGKGEECIEFVKKVDDNLQLGLEVDTTNGYIYVSTLHPVSDGKISYRLGTGRLKPAK